MATNFTNFTEIGINFNVFANTSFTEFSNLTNQTTNDFIESIPTTANNITDGYFGIVILLVMGVWLMWMLSDKTQFGLFRYSSVRAMVITLGIILTFGINLIQIGYMTSFVQLTILSTLFIIMFVYVLIANPS